MSAEFDNAVRSFPIVAWLQQYTKVRPANGDEVRIDCPSCGGRLTLGINVFTKLSGCFKCRDGFSRIGWSGKANLVGLLKLFSKCTDRQALEQIYASAGRQLPDREQAVVAEEVVKLPEEAFELKSTLPDHPASLYLQRRGMSHLVPHSSVCLDGKYKGRIILPCHTFGELHGFEAKAYIRIKPKALFPTWMQTEQFFYTTYNWDTTANFVVITESVLDAETYGVNAIGVYGSTLKDGQLLKLLELRSRGITRLVWSLDQDAWRKQAGCLLRQTGLFFENLVVDLPKFQDPNSIGRQACWDLVSRARPVEDAVDYLFGKFAQIG